MVTIRSPEYSVNVRAELARYEWTAATWTHDRLIAASPFRYDRTPSFYVYLVDTESARAGDWGDPGAVDAEWQRGGIVKLLAYLMNVTYGEAADYLYATYTADDVSDTVTLPQLSLSLAREPYRPLPDSTLLPYRYRSPYLGGRSITESVQRLMRVGYDPARKAVTMPWFNADGSLGNVKYRRVDAKVFWYAKGGRPIRDMLYGIDVIYARKIRKAAIVEAEIDAMTLMSAGIPAIAIGGSAFTETKRQIIARSPLEAIFTVEDNDDVGRALMARVRAELSGVVQTGRVTLNSEVKDANQLATESGLEAVKRAVDAVIWDARISAFLP